LDGPYEDSLGLIPGFDLKLVCCRLCLRQKGALRMRNHFSSLQRRRSARAFLLNESGQGLILVCLCMFSLLGFLGLATDVGVHYRARTNLQKVADAAAIAGAAEYAKSGSWLAAAKGSALQNGVDCTATGINCNITIGTSAHPSAVSV